jgi:hypothetical protein
MFGAKRFTDRFSLVARAHKLPLSMRLRVLAYAGFPCLLAPWFAAKRLLAGKR